VAAGEADRLLAVARSQPEPERPGRVELLVWSTMYGAWLGLAIPVIGKSDAPEVYGLGMLLGAPIGFFSARQYLKTHPVTEGQARAITFGGTWGSWQGLGWTEVLDLGAPTCGFDYCDNSPPAETVMAGTVVGGLAGIATGAILARKPITSGVATSVSFGGLWGTWYGLAAGILLDLEDDDLLAATLAGGDVGVLAMATLAPKWNPSRNRARLVSLGGLVGVLVGGGLDLIIQPEDEKVAILIPAATSVAGLLISANSLKPRAPAGGDDGGPGGPDSGSRWPLGRGCTRGRAVAGAGPERAGEDVALRARVPGPLLTIRGPASQNGVPER
jgi:hypothetical protein